MMTFVAVIHILVAIALIGLVLIQDSKGGGALGMGGGSNSLLGATGAQTLAAKVTRWAAVIFAITCLSLTMMTSQSTKSVLDSGSALPTTPPPPKTPADMPAGSAPSPAAGSENSAEKTPVEAAPTTK